MHSAADNAEMTRQCYEALWNQRDRSVIERWIAPDYVGYYTRQTDPIRGIPGFTKMVDELFLAFPDLQVSLEDVIASGDRVASRIRIQGTHRGPLEGYGPSGARVSSSFLAIERYDGDGRCIEEWVHSDDLGIARQIGALPDAGGLLERAAKALHRVAAPLLRWRHRGQL